LPKIVVGGGKNVTDRLVVVVWLAGRRRGDRRGGAVVVSDRRAAGHFAICFANSANKGIEAPRARKWDEVYTLIKQRWPEPGV